MFTLFTSKPNPVGFRFRSVPKSPILSMLTTHLLWHMTWLYFIMPFYNISHNPSQQKTLHRQIRVSVPSERVATRGPMRHSPTAWILGPGVGTSSKRWWLTSGKDTKNIKKRWKITIFKDFLWVYKVYKSTISMGMFNSYVKLPEGISSKPEDIGKSKLENVLVNPRICHDRCK